MKEQKDISGQTTHQSSIIKSVLMGSVFGLILIGVFLLRADGHDPSWPRLWWLRPLLVVPLAGALWGVIYFYMTREFSRQGWSRALALVLGILGFLVAIWLGMVLGLDGTYWD